MNSRASARLTHRAVTLPTEDSENGPIAVDSAADCQQLNDSDKSRRERENNAPATR